MTTIVNSWDDWSPLKRVILGRPEGTNIPAPDPRWWPEQDSKEGGYPLGTYGPFPQEMVDAANEQMDNFASVMEKRGIIVDRVEVHPAMLDRRAISTPEWTQLNQYGINNPRDLFLNVGNEIIEAPCCRRSRWFEYLNLRPLFERYFKQDSEFLWTAAPRPRLTDESFEKDYFFNFQDVWTDEEKEQRIHDQRFGLTETEPLWDAADSARFGKDIFWQPSAVTNRSGIDWLKRHFRAKGIRIHPVQFVGWLHPWHIDDSVVVVRPGLAVHPQGRPPLTEEFLELFKRNNWELIPGVEPTYVHRHKVRLFTDYGQTSWISLNTLSLGPNTICVEAHETAYMEQLDKLGVEVVPIPYDHVIPFGGALHCTTLDVYREGDCEDYFPNQIPGY